MSQKILGDSFDSHEVTHKCSSEKREREKLKKAGSNDNGDSGKPQESNSHFSGIGFFQEEDESISIYNQEELRVLTHMGAVDGQYFDVVSPPFQYLGDNIRIASHMESQNSHTDEERSHAFPSTSLQILKSFRSKLTTVNARNINGELNESKKSSLSTNHILELAAGNFIQSNSVAAANELSAISHPYASSFLGLSITTTKDVQLVQDLLSCAEKAGNQQYSCARKLLEECNKLSSNKTSTIERLVYCFTEALKEKMDRDTGRVTGKSDFSFDSIPLSPATIAFQKNLPFTQVTFFARIQTVMDHVSTSRKVHIIDLQTRCGVFLILMMESLASRSECPLEHLKITTVASQLKLSIEEIRVRLENMADSLKLSFSFHVVMLEDILNNQKNLFDIDDKEAVIVNAPYVFKNMISKQHQLESLIRAIKKTNPLLMIISESESNVNSPIFVNRFVEALFYFGAYFDCMNDCLKDVEDRTSAETSIISPAIRNIVAAEGDDRNIRIVSIDIWKKFFSRFGMVEIELGKLALSHAYLIRNTANCGDSCTLSLNGNCLVVSWKGIPISSLSAWNFKGKQSTKYSRT